jgi:hypothetical protein
MASMALDKVLMEHEGTNHDREDGFQASLRLPALPPDRTHKGGVRCFRELRASRLLRLGVFVVRTLAIVAFHPASARREAYKRRAISGAHAALMVEWLCRTVVLFATTEALARVNFDSTP